MDVAQRPCSSCPYVVWTPPGLWHPDEYAKLPRYDDDVPGHEQPLGVFLCHQHGREGDTACRGWLSTNPDAIAVRLAISRGQLTVAQRDAAPGAELYATGARAAEAGMAGVAEPSPEAIAAMARLEGKLRRARSSRKR